MAASGHEDQFLPLRLSVRSVIRKQTVAATRGNGRDAPGAAVRAAMTEPLESPHNGCLSSSKAIGRHDDDHGV
jgi:hypothetical protein